MNSILVFILSFFEWLGSLIPSNEPQQVATAEKFVPGDYTSIGVVNIRKQMNTQSNTNLFGAYMNGTPFRVYEVYPEKDGIVWGRVSSNTGEGTSLYVGMRVLNNVKVHLEAPTEQPALPIDLTQERLVSSIELLTQAIDRNTLARS